MTAEAAVGAEVSVQLGQAVGQLAAGVSTLNGRLARLQARLDSAPRFIWQATTITLDSSGNGTASLDGPKTGYQWTMRNLAVSPLADYTTSMGAGIGWLFAGTIGSAEAGGAGVLSTNLRWIMPTLPNAAIFSSDEIVVQYGEHAYFRVTGGTASQAVAIVYAYQLYKPPGGRAEVAV